MQMLKSETFKLAKETDGAAQISSQGNHFRSSIHLFLLETSSYALSLLSVYVHSLCSSSEH